MTLMQVLDADLVPPASRLLMGISFMCAIKHQYKKAVKVGNKILVTAINLLNLRNETICIEICLKMLSVSWIFELITQIDFLNMVGF